MTEPYKETIKLVVDAPTKQLQGENNGLAYSINRLRTIKGLLRDVSLGYAEFAAKLKMVGSGGPTAATGAAFSQATLQNIQQLKQGMRLIEQMKIAGESFQRRQTFGNASGSLTNVVRTWEAGGKLESETRIIENQDKAQRESGRKRIDLFKHDETRLTQARKEARAKQQQEEEMWSSRRWRQAKTHSGVTGAAFEEADRRKKLGIQLEKELSQAQDATQRDAARRRIDAFKQDQARELQVKKEGLTRQQQEDSMWESRRASQARARSANLAPAFDVMEKQRTAAAARARSNAKAMMAAEIGAFTGEGGPGNAGYIGRNMLENLKKVSAWTAALGAFYGAVRLATSGVRTLVDTGLQTARLTQVFRGQASEAARLTDRVMALAAANGRSTQEAMESAIQWSRLGMNRIQVAEAVRVSLMAANVAEIDAARATEQLSAIYATWGLRAFELGSVLGQLNQVSNIHNASVKDLMDSLARMGPIAHQAGLSLSEAIGFSGAMRGATGQTGANIGNAIKSIVGAMSDAGKLKTLRETFQFEGTEGAEGTLKNMSELLGELFVAYNRMGEAERRSMMFSVVGKNQAARFAAMLDTYVKAQTLAINAQLNLNSAEAENAKIKATLKNQMQGLVTEWDRFVMIQGNRGPAQGLNQLTKLMHNFIRLSNTAAGSWATTGIGMMLTGMALKMGLVAFQMEKVGRGGGIIRNTIAAVAGEAKNLGGILAATLAGGSIWGGGVTRALPGERKLSGMPDARKNDPVTALKQLGAGAVIARGAMMTLTDVLLPLAAIAGAVWLLNKAFDALGLSTDSIDEHLGKFAQTAENASKAAEAATMQGRLMRNVQKVFEGSGTSAEARMALAGQVSEAFVPYESGDTDKDKRAKDARRDALKSELLAISDMTDAEARLAKSRTFWDAREAESIERNMRKRVQSRNAMMDEMNAIERALQKPFLSKGKRSELEMRKEALGGGVITSMLEDSEENATAMERFRETSVAFKTFVEAQKALKDQTASLFNQLPTGGARDKWSVGMGQGQFDIGNLERQLAKANAAVSAAGLPSQSMEATRAWASQESVAIKRGRMATQNQYETALRSRGTDTGDFGAAVGEITAAEKVKSEALAELDKRQAELTRVEGQLAKAQSDVEHRRLISERDELQKQLEARRSEVGGMAGGDSMAETFDRRNTILRLGHSKIGALAIGDTEGDQFYNQMKRLAPLRDYHAYGETEKLDKLQVSLELMEGMVKAQERINELGREETNLRIQANREYQRGILMAGPAEMLRKMAVQQMSIRAMTSGQFLSLSTDARQDFESLPGNTRGERAARRNRGGYQRWLNEFAPTPEARSRLTREGYGAHAELYRQLAPPEVDVNAKLAATSMSFLAKETQNLVVAFRVLSQALPIIMIPSPLTGPINSGTTPRR